QPELVIKPRRGWIAVDWRELWNHRELLYFLVWRDVKVRYKQSVLGVAWAVLVPVLNMLVATLLFGVVFHLGKGIVGPNGKPSPYAILVFAALLPWQLFSNSVSQGGLSLLNQQHLLTKIYFPRLFIPTAAVGGLLVDMAISFGVLIALMTIYHFVPTYQFVPYWGIVFVPFLTMLTVISGLGAAYLLSALTVTYRDFRFLIPFAVQILSLMSFVQFPAETVVAGHPKLSWVLSINPMFGVVAGFRSAILGQPFHLGYLLVSIVVSVTMLVFGMFYFRKTERRFADIA
ncbi:MAG TPA: ABC transporter permease, partial [Tepidisphaeraceae bacterium]|nr:ABC transporter permease [Tepidisphaeraceae bacterium]